VRAQSESWTQDTSQSLFPLLSAYTAIVAAIPKPHGRVRRLGSILNRIEPMRKLNKKLGSAKTLHVCYVAGTIGYVLHW